MVKEMVREMVDTSVDRCDGHNYCHALLLSTSNTIV